MPDQAFPYPGGKARMSDDIIDLLPDHRCYVEPFGGGAAVLLQKPESDVEVYNDVSGDLVAFFEVARDRPDDLIEWLDRTPFSRELHDRYTDRLYGDADAPDDAVERAGMFFLTRHTSFGGKIDDAFKRPRPRDGGDTWARMGLWYDSGRAAIEDVSERFARVVIENESVFDIIDRYDSPSTCFYFDPPYVDAESYYGRSFDHDAFVERLHGVDGAFILSYGDDVPDGVDAFEELRSDIQRSIGNEDADGDRMTERIIMNFDPYDVTPFAGKDQAGVDEFL